MAGTLLFAVEGATAAFAFAAAALAFFFFLHHFVQEIPGSIILTLDAAGLSLFAMAGAEGALEHGMHPFIAIVIGGITGVGGGILRDIARAQIPNVLRADIYATAALAGAAVMIPAGRLRRSPTAAAFGGGRVCFVLRMASVRRHWNLPRFAT